IPVTESRPGIVHCPPPSLSFVGRESTLKQIEKCIFDGSGHRHVFVLYGLGGAGKTQIALSFVDRFKDRYAETNILPNSFWETFFVDATSLETIASCLEGIAEIAGEGKNANDVLKWLSSQNKRWLMVFDNADDPKINLGDYFPKSTTGDILITTKNNQMLVYAKGKEPHTRVQEMEHGEAKRLLLEKAELEDTEDVNVDVKTLLQVSSNIALLGHLALAIVQAGAYIRVKRYGLKRYLELFWSYHLDLLEDPQIGQTGDCERSVYMTWRMNFSQLSPSAQTLLQIAAFMHHSDISEDIFRRAYAGAASFEPILNLSNDQKTAKEYIVDFLSRFQALDRTWDTLKFSVVISELESYSLISLDQFNRNYNIHPLVHLWARSTCANPSVLAASTIWLIALAVTKGDASIDYAFRRTLVPHMSAVPSTQVLCFDVASSFARVYHETGQFMLAEKLQKQVLETSRRLLGMTHLYTLGMLSNLAVTYQAQHRWEDALKLQTEELQARKCIQNHKHPSMLTCMHNMASSYRNMGHLEDAERMRLEVLKARAETLGEDDPDTLCTMHNLATLYRKQGRYPEAEKLGLEVVAGCRRVLKCDHPKTLMAMNSLATIYQTQKKWLQAEELRKDAFNISKRVLGRDDPKTILSMKKLLVVYEKQGKTREAELLRLEKGDIQQMQ
ncbi:TPR-like protein, partial [Ceratobasidium sp. AG-I]